MYRLGGLLFFSVCAVKKGLGGIGGILIPAADRVGVNLQGNGGVTVPDTGSDGNGTNAIGKQDGSVGVVQVRVTPAYP